MVIYISENNVIPRKLCSLPRLNIKQDVTPDGVSAELQILNSDATDNGAYFCQATNMYGKDQQLVQLLVQEPPMSPQNVETTMIGSRSVNLKWQHRSGDSSEVFKFIVEYRQQDSKYHAHVLLICVHLR